MPTFTGTSGDDTLTGGAGADTIDGLAGNDVLHGGAGNDQIDGGSGQDQIFGDDGDDLLIVSAAPVAGEVYNGGADTDTLRFLASAGTLVTTATDPLYQGSLTGTTLTSFERLEFGSTAGTALSVLFGMPQIGAGLAATAELVGGAGFDQLRIVATVGGTYTIPTFTYSNWTNADEAFEAGDTVLLVGFGNNNYTLNAAAGHFGYQILVGGNGSDTLNGTDGLEVLIGGDGLNTLNAGGGDDNLFATNTTPFGGSQTNFVYLNNIFNGGAGFDWLSVGGFVDFRGSLVSIEGINFQPAFTATGAGAASQGVAALNVEAAAFDLLPATLNLRGTGFLEIHLAPGTGFDGSQWVHLPGSSVAIDIQGTNGSETIIGTSGNDRLSSGFGADTLTGGGGSDEFEAGDGQHVVTDFTVGSDRVDLRDMNITSLEQAQAYLSQVGANVVFSRMYGGVAQTMTLLNVNLASLTAASFSFQIDNEDDTRIGTDGVDDLIGAGGADHLEGLGDNDYLFAGSGNDFLDGGTGDDSINGGGGVDSLTGGLGNDTFQDTAGNLSGDTITDFAAGDRILFTDASLAGFTFSVTGSTLTYSGGSLTLAQVPAGTLVASAAAGGGVQISIQTTPPDVRNDFNGDGRSDILWRHTDGTIGNWLANANGTHTSNGASVSPVPNNWHIVGTGDFNGDGRDDILWRSDAGEVGNWLAGADGSFAYNAAAGVTVIPLSWQVEAVGDFNADGKDDILWRNTDGTVGVWSGQGNGGFIANNAAVFNVATEWQIVGTGDFNGDGKDDILWRHSSGTFADWLANGSGGFSPNFGSLVAISSDWHIIGTGDFNNDGRDDILWRHDSGTVANWTANADGTFMPNFASLVTITNDWNVASIGDYNGDGRDDILWRHDSGTIADWLANTDNSGTFTTNIASFAGVPTDWQVQDPAILIL